MLDQVPPARNEKRGVEGCIIEREHNTAISYVNILPFSSPATWLRLHTDTRASHRGVSGADITASAGMAHDLIIERRAG